MTADGVAAPWLEARDSRSRLVVAALLVVAVVAIGHVGVATAALVAALALALAAGVTPGRLVRRLAVVEGFVVLLMIVLPLTAPTGPWIALGPLELSVDGLRRAVSIALRASAAATLVLALIGGLDPVRLGHGLSRLGLPLRLTELLLFCFRYIDLVGGEARRLQEAMRLRGFSPRTDWHTLRTYGNFIGQMLLRSHDRAERIVEAMLCRGYVGRYPVFSSERLRRGDAAFVGAATVAAGLLLSLDRLCLTP